MSQFIQFVCIMIENLCINNYVTDILINVRLDCSITNKAELNRSILKIVTVRDKTTQSRGMQV